MPYLIADYRFELLDSSADEINKRLQICSEVHKSSPVEDDPPKEREPQERRRKIFTDHPTDCNLGIGPHSGIILV